MAEFGKSIKSVLMRSMEAIGNTANNIASNTRYKVSEMNMLNRREEILSSFGIKAYELYQKGAAFPEELMTQLEELASLDSALLKLRAEHIANSETKTDDKLQEPESAEETETAQEPDDEPVADAETLPEEETEAAPETDLEEKPEETDDAAALS